MSASSFSQSVSATLADGVLAVTIDNPPVNATSTHVRIGLMAALDHAEADATIVGIVLTGAGRTFVGGADIKEFGKPPVEPLLPDVINRIEGLKKPVVAAVNGAALGGGCEIILACHGRIASVEASFGLPEVKLGIVPGAGGTQRLPRLIGTFAAIDLIGTGRVVKANEALSLGLVDGSVLQRLQVQLHRRDRRFQLVGDGVDERLVLLVAADLAHQEDRIEHDAGDDEGKHDEAGDEQPGLAPVEDDPADVEGDDACHQADAEDDEERDRLPAPAGPHARLTPSRIAAGRARRRPLRRAPG